jgi:hypothetical protein
VTQIEETGFRFPTTPVFDLSVVVNAKALIIL